MDSLLRPTALLQEARVGTGSIATKDFFSDDYIGV